MANTFKFGNEKWAVGKETVLAYNDENNNFKPLPFTFDRGSIATVVNKDGLIETVGIDEPRIDFLNNSKGHLLLEPQRQNIIPYSEDFSDSSWNVFRGSVTADVIISPDGTQNASRYQEDSQTGGHLFRRQNLSITNGLSYTGSIFIKKGELTSITLQSNSSSRWVASATFDVENGVVTSGTGVIEDYGNGWYRCSISGNAVQTTTVAGLEMLTSVGAGRDGDGLYMYGAMFEQGSYATSYIPTSGSAVTRSAESTADAGNSQVIGSSNGTVFIDVKQVDTIDASSNTDFTVIKNSSNVNIGLYSLFLHSTGNIRLYNTVDNSSVTLKSGDNRGQRLKIAFAYANADFVTYINGVKVYENTGISLQSGLDSIALNATPNLGLTIANEVKLYNTRLSNNELATLTTL